MFIWCDNSADGEITVSDCTADGAEQGEQASWRCVCGAEDFVEIEWGQLQAEPACAGHVEGGCISLHFVIGFHSADAGNGAICGCGLRGQQQLTGKLK